MRQTIERAKAKARTGVATVGDRALDQVLTLGTRIADAPTVVRGMAAEAGWIATHAAFYPIGIVSERLREPVDRYTMTGLPPLHRSLMAGDVAAAGTPILLLHGFVDNRSIFTRLRRSLRHRGFGRVVTLNLPLVTTDIQTAARRLADEVETLCEQTGYAQVHVVAHSLGGLVARYYVQKLGGDLRVHTLVMLGTPHTGAGAARLVPSVIPFRLTRQLRPGSPVLTELAGPAPGCRTRFVCYAGDLDKVVPFGSALLEHPDLDIRHVRVKGTGHHSLTFNGRVVHDIAATLAELPADEAVAWAPSLTVVTDSGGAVSTYTRPPAPPRHAPPPASDVTTGAKPG